MSWGFAWSELRRRSRARTVARDVACTDSLAVPLAPLAVPSLALLVALSLAHAAGAQAAPASSPAAPSAAPPTASTKEKASKEKGSEGKEKAPPPLFASDSTVSLIIRVSNLEAFMKDRDSTTKRPYAATIRYASSATDSVSVPVELRARGHYRRKKSNCSFPPVHVTFGDKETTKGTLFAKQRPLKLVTPCREKDNTYEQYIVREYMAYRVYNLLTPRSYKVRLVRVTYQDSLGKVAPVTRHAFFVENDKALASRLNGELIEQKGIGIHLVDPDQYGLMAMFEYMIGNTDWSMPAQHNVRLVRDSSGTTYSIPYDFDFSGLVNTRYAVPDSTLNIPNVTVRLYRGDCRTQDELLPIFSQFATQRDPIYALYKGQPGLDERSAKDAVSYLKEFYDVVENRKEWRIFNDYCERR